MQHNRIHSLTLYKKKQKYVFAGLCMNFIYNEWVWFMQAVPFPVYNKSKL